jgi:hypothetical protein
VSGRDVGAEDERALAMTLFSLVRPGFTWFPRLVFVLGRASSTDAVRRLSFIHFARLSVIEQLPDLGQPRETLRPALQLFESNYNGSFSQYIDSFVEAVPQYMRLFWGTSYGFPWRVPWRIPLGPFRRYVDASEFPIDHYYVAIPDASVTMIESALRVAEANTQFRREVVGMDPREFLKRFEDFLTQVQGDL